MIIPDALRDKVRQRAGFACEYCGLREADVGGQLTVDHFQPRSKGGSDEFSNLIYCCIWCNQRKLASGRSARLIHNFGILARVVQSNISFSWKMENYIHLQRLAFSLSSACTLTDLHSLPIVCVSAILLNKMHCLHIIAI